MTFPTEFIAYLVQFHGSRDYFECHEILEEYWKEVDSRNKKSHWVGLILLSVSSYHHRRENFIGAEKTLKKAINIIEETSSTSISSLGLDYQQLLLLMRAVLSKIQEGVKYESFSLPINNDQLLFLCQQECNLNGYEWNGSNLNVDEQIIHRHLLRDRSDVIKEREHQKALRHSNEQRTNLS